jgi:hypothetical protein
VLQWNRVPFVVCKVRREREKGLLLQWDLILTSMSVQQGDNQSLSFDSCPGWWCYVSSLSL